MSGPGFDLGLRFDRDLHAFAIGPEGWVRDHLQQRLDRFNRLGRQEKIDQIIGGALRYGPYALIALLPWFAFLLQIVYAGRRRSYPQRPRRYAEHLVYGAHNHAFACLALIVAVAVPLPPLRAAAVLWMLGYFLWSMKVVYGGRWSGVLAPRTGRVDRLPDRCSGWSPHSCWSPRSCCADGPRRGPAR